MAPSPPLFSHSSFSPTSLSHTTIQEARSHETGNTKIKKLNGVKCEQGSLHQHRRENDSYWIAAFATAAAGVAMEAQQLW
jgi:hypothetical protein